ncbi:nuclear transport factor 2 family protein [Granulicella arctica]|uniref:nuclear transport factor 2 family protein n=1 Tax=Granulicella arctica TaxID=940613 RepID=UPI0021E0BA48|nr:nuclear transport factor 2 family protein [Granulicella arctica]
MKTPTTSRRTFLVIGTALAASSALRGEEPINPEASRATANWFLSKWIEAWNHHDAHQLGLLQTSDANTVNRFGTLVQGRAAVEKALGFLHNPGGPYHDVTAPPLQLLDVRQIAPTVIILQASWKSPVMNPDGKLDLAKEDDMLVSYTLLKAGGEWKGTQMDLHNVEKMDLPYSTPEQRR